MKQFDPIPIDIIVGQLFEDLKVQAITSEWRIEPTRVQEICVKIFREMGLYFAFPNHRMLILRSILTILSQSVELRLMVRKAEAEERQRRQSRHADL